MATYTQLSQTDIDYITKEYNLDIESFSSIDGGAGNSSYRLCSNERDFVLTVFDEKSYEEVLYLGELLLLLQEYHFSATVPLRLRDSSVVTQYLNKPLMIKEYIYGTVYEELDKNMLGSIGRNLAKLHLIPIPHYLPKQHSYGLEFFSSLTRVGIDPQYEVWLEEQLDILTQSIPIDLPKALIHGDLFYDNVLFLEKKFQAIIDFEEACNYYRVFDLGMAIVGLCRDGKSIDLNKVEALVGGYQEIIELELRERESLQMFSSYAATATSSWRFWKYNIDLKESDNFRKHWDMAELSQNISAIDKERFMQRVFTL